MQAAGRFFLRPLALSDSLLYGRESHRRFLFHPPARTCRTARPAGNASASRRISWPRRDRRPGIFLSHLLSLCGLCIARPALGGNAGPGRSRRENGPRPGDFHEVVRALLTDRCLKCHGGEKTRSGLDLGTREGLLKGGDKGLVVVARPGQGQPALPASSPTSTSRPCRPRRTKLSDDAVAQIAAWIDLGAPYDKPLLDKAGRQEADAGDRRGPPLLGVPAAETAAGAAVKDAAWRRTPIDSFILAKLEEKGLTPNAPADRRKLIRRAYFDLLGLPPTPEEVEAFVADPAPDAYEKLIDRLLDNPHYGERWARHWLDLAHFAESHGYEHDYDRPTAYPYRDFVIKAFNQDLPYDTFVKWQIAGDEIEPDNPLALTATGFLGAGVHSTQITQNQVEKERYDELDDIVRTTGTAMLGLTVGCARCHDHKYDPIPTRDYYRLLSTFTTTVRSDRTWTSTPRRSRRRGRRSTPNKRNSSKPDAVRTEGRP